MLNDVCLSTQMLNSINGYMNSNQLHINQTKFVYMQFRPYLNHSERVTAVKFLGVIIVDRLFWEPQINHLKGKLLSCIVVIKRIRKFIPKYE